MIIPELLYYLLTFVLLVVIHELGHMIMAKALGYRTRLRFRWYAILVDIDDMKRMTPRQSFLIANAGILSGGFFLVLIDASFELMLIYIIMCFIDFNIVYDAVRLDKRYRDTPFPTLMRLQADELEQRRWGD